MKHRLYFLFGRRNLQINSSALVLLTLMFPKKLPQNARNLYWVYLCEKNFRNFFDLFHEWEIFRSPIFTYRNNVLKRGKKEQKKKNEMRSYNNVKLMNDCHLSRKSIEYRSTPLAEWISTVSQFLEHFAIDGMCATAKRNCVTDVARNFWM